MDLRTWTLTWELEGGKKALPCLLVLLLPIAGVLWGVFDTIVQSLVVSLFRSLSSLCLRDLQDTKAMDDHKWFTGEVQSGAA